MVLKKTGVILGLLVLGVAAGGYYLTLQPPDGVAPKSDGGSAGMFALAASLTSLAGSIIGLGMKYLDFRMKELEMRAKERNLEAE